MKNIDLSVLAEMAELADALVSGTSARKGMGVRLPLSAFFIIPILVESFLMSGNRKSENSSTYFVEKLLQYVDSSFPSNFIRSL